jgi:hypothetical protein
MNTLTYYEQRGTIAYQNWATSLTIVEGWFYLENDYVVMRKIGGRNRSRFIKADQIVDFTPHQKAHN